MIIKISKPHPDYPFAWVHVPIGTDIDPDHGPLTDIFERNQITLLGRWESHMVDGAIDSLKAPVLLEDEHVKPPKRRSRKK
jgi:hypothetical protein